MNCYTSELADRTLQVRAIRLLAPDAVVEYFHSLLTPDESARARRFRFSHLQRSFILGRGALRILLGQYLNTTPADVRFQYGLHGKPSIGAATRLRFNVSHSGTLALFGFALDCEVGVDIEEVRPLPDMPEIAARFFSAEEAAEVMSLSGDRREAAFFRCWTRKEAYLKALGFGLTGMPTGKETCSVQQLDIAPQYAAALAYLDAARPLHVLPVADAAQLL